LKEVIAMDERRILIVANQTAAGQHLKDLVRNRLKEGPCSFVLLVPATPPHGTLTYTDEETTELAQRRMKEAIEGLNAAGVKEIEGQVGDGSPADAVEALMQIENYEHHQPFDEIILSTLPPGISRWLKQDLAHRFEKHYGVPVTHVIGSADSSVS
jgi:hypothetical protein